MVDEKVGVRHTARNDATASWQNWLDELAIQQAMHARDAALAPRTAGSRTRRSGHAPERAVAHRGRRISARARRASCGAAWRTGRESAGGAALRPRRVAPPAV